jgi:alkanesulfonate monooxygenase SsuD/methylene tetrahydromethanopterin reductase-like flavin-dependent oxidoreductase (luciferase family)
MNENMSGPAIGVIFHPKFPPETLADYARRAESAGFDELWLWDDCFLPGAFTSAAIALSATRTLKVGIGLLPATVYNPLFAAMEITTLACAFPDRILAGFGHGVGEWMAQIGAAPKSSLKALGETLPAVRQLLGGEMVSIHGEQVHLDKVQMQLTPRSVPPLYVGAMREKSLQLAGRVGDGTILTGMSSPAYVSWAREHIRAGMVEAGRAQHRIVVYMDVKVHQDGEMARSTMRRYLAARLPWTDVQLNALGIADEVAALTQAGDIDEIARQIPDAWVDTFCAAGSPQQAADAVQRLYSAGADSVVFQPLDGDADCLDETIRYLMPKLKGI